LYFVVTYLKYMKNLSALNLNNKRVLVRVDFNVPVSEQGVITDDNRIKQAVPTIKKILEMGGKPILMSHLGEPEGRDLKFSLAVAAERLQQLLGSTVKLATDCIGPEVENHVEQLSSGQVLILENLRFHAGEKKNDPEFCKALAKLGDVFVNDAFATAHRKHASMVGIPALFKEKAPGLLMQREMDYYAKALLNPKRPLCVVLGGAKISTKLAILENLAQKADKLIIGGAMSNTFLTAQGLQMGRSKFEQEYIGKALEILGQLARRGCKVYLPVDVVVAPSLNVKGLSRAVPVQEVPADSMALDIGPASSIVYKQALQNAETIVWNGPMGVFENEEFAKGTTDLIEAMSQAHGIKVVGGGDTDSAIHQMQLEHKFDFISTGGGAFLQLLEGNSLPGFDALN
jgi:phosphoglycerate kinase